MYLVEYLILNIQKKKKKEKKSYYYHSKLDIQKRYVTSLFAIILRYDNNKKWKKKKNKTRTLLKIHFDSSISRNLNPLPLNFNVGTIHSILHV